MNDGTLRFNLFPKQREFVDCTGNIARQLLYHGGTGSSKSHSLIVKWRRRRLQIKRQSSRRPALAAVPL